MSGQDDSIEKGTMREQVESGSHLMEHDTNVDTAQRLLP